MEVPYKKINNKLSPKTWEIKLKTPNLLLHSSPDKHGAWKLLCSQWYRASVFLFQLNASSCS